MPKSGYLARQQEERRNRDHIIKNWTAQLCLDIFCTILNDPKIMGKDTFGEARLVKIGTEFNDRFDEFQMALSKDVEADYLRDKMDRIQRQIFKEKALPWEKRYLYWSKK